MKTVVTGFVITISSMVTNITDVPVVAVFTSTDKKRFSVRTFSILLVLFWQGVHILSDKTASDPLLSFARGCFLPCSGLDPHYDSSHGLKHEDNREVQVMWRASRQQPVLPQQIGECGLHF